MMKPGWLHGFVIGKLTFKMETMLFISMSEKCYGKKIAHIIIQRLLKYQRYPKVVMLQLLITVVCLRRMENQLCKHT